MCVFYQPHSGNKALWVAMANITRFLVFRLRALQEEYFDRLNPEDFRKMQALESPLKTASKVAGKGQKSKNVVKTVWDEVRGWPRLNTETCVLMDPEVKKTCWYKLNIRITLVYRS